MKSLWLTLKPFQHLFPPMSTHHLQRSCVGWTHLDTAREILSESRCRYVPRSRFIGVASLRLCVLASPARGNGVYRDCLIPAPCRIRGYPAHASLPRVVIYGVIPVDYALPSASPRC